MHRAACHLLEINAKNNSSQPNKYDPETREKEWETERTGIKAEESNPAGFHGYLQAISGWRDRERKRKRVG